MSGTTAGDHVSGPETPFGSQAGARTVAQHADGHDRTRVLIVDDDPLVRQQIRLILATCEDVEVVSEAADGADAVSQTTLHRPEVVLMDVSMPTMDGIDATAAILSSHPDVRVVVLTAMGDDDMMIRALSVGAVGFVPKEYAGEDLAIAVRRVRRGEGYVSPHSQPHLFQRLTQGQQQDRGREAALLFERLTSREREVAHLVATGAKTAVIAAELFVSESTVKSQLDSIRTKLGVSSREEIAVLVERAGAAS